MFDVGSHDFINLWRSSSESLLVLNTGLDDANRFTLTASKMITKALGWGDNNGLSIFNIDYQAYEESGDDEWRLIFEA